MTKIRRYSYPAIGALIAFWGLTWLFYAVVNWGACLLFVGLFGGPGEVAPSFSTSLWWMLPWVILYALIGYLIRRKNRANR